MKIKERNKNIQNMEGNVFSTYTNTVREIFADTDESIAKFIFDGNIYSVGEPHDVWNGENGAFPPTRDGCIHSLSMRERG